MLGSETQRSKLGLQVSNEGFEREHWADLYTLLHVVSACDLGNGNSLLVAFSI